MHLPRRLWSAATVLTALLALGACSAHAQATVSPFAGHWTSTQWGQHYIVVEDSTVKIVYDHDQGRVVGQLNRATMTGWWTEAPSRQLPKDAGDVTFTLTGTGDTRRIDGTWRYSNAGPTLENWDLTWVGPDIPADAAATLADAAAFLPHP